ncbi:ArnT family glycosyltransferase [Hymenobacter pini]|uniref:ArnT family glycosyltransferase n=1 Tax=Hymenobacter pini TaxID=2880879 RepID=UPI001CF4DBE0|nr:glycosyltransferase family 39 protein [Hymenobacter pini]MCA8830258.1 glycosyltransferase family 39 protein [Hymenobacter pini]
MPSFLHQVSSSRWGRVATVLGVCACSFFWHGSAPAVSLMEARNFVAAREMVAGGSWLIPTMNGELRLAKPPLPTWATAAVQLVTGPTHDLGILRLPAAIMATLLVVFFWGLARELTRNQPAETAAPGRTAWLGGLILASSLLVITTGREGQWDIFANSWMVGCLWLLVRGWQRPDGGWASIVGGGVLAGLAILSKGPVPLYGLLLPFLVAYSVGQPDNRARVREHWKSTLAAVVVALGIGLSWPAYIWWHVAPAARAVAHTEISSWAERHVQPIWYYWSFFAFTGLWALTALAGLIPSYARRRVSPYIPYMLALGWAVIGLILLSLVPEKKERYMLPLMPPLALLVAGVLRHWESGLLARTDKLLVRSWGVLLASIALALPILMAVTSLPGFGLWSTRWIMGVVLFLGVAGWIGGWGLCRPRVKLLTGATFLLAGGILGLLMPAYPAWEARRDTPGLVRITDVRRLPMAQGISQWRSLDTVHVKQVWNVGRTVPVWHPTIDSLKRLYRPVMLLAGSPIHRKLPVGWDKHVRLHGVDSFYLGRNASAGYWFVARIDPILK